MARRLLRRGRGPILHRNAQGRKALESEQDMDKGTDSGTSGSLPGPISDSAEPFASAEGCVDSAASGLRPLGPTAAHRVVRARRRAEAAGPGIVSAAAAMDGGRTRSVLRRARSRHQQLPAADRRAVARRLSASSMRSRASSGSARAWRRAGASARPRWSAPSTRLRICGQKLDARPMARRPADRHPGLPRGRERRSTSSTASATRSGCELEIVDRRTEARLAAEGCFSLLDPGGGRRGALRHRRRLVGDRLARPAQGAPPRRPRPRLGFAAGRRRHARRAARRRRRRRARVRGDGRRRARRVSPLPRARRAEGRRRRPARSTISAPPAR